MKTCCLVWEIPVIEGEHYNPIMNVIYMQKAKKFLNQLNRYFQDENMDWKCVLDRSACTYNEIFSSENQAVIFVPEAKTRQWLYKKDILFSFSPSWSFYQMKVPGFVGKISLRIQGLCVYNEYIVKDGIFS